MHFAFLLHRMKYVGKAQVRCVKKFLRGRSEDTVKILAASAVLATVSSSGAEFSFLRVSFAEKEMRKCNLAHRTKNIR